ncbi:MAG: hypothetical protein KIH65_003900 [Candidatus Uhrbacteria bacterium]|nr:hypothetical protein [Candidatus Uhrbacteria bacterium]
MNFKGSRKGLSIVALLIVVIGIAMWLFGFDGLKKIRSDAESTSWTCGELNVANRSRVTHADIAPFLKPTEEMKGKEIFFPDCPPGILTKAKLADENATFDFSKCICGKKQ